MSAEEGISVEFTARELRALRVTAGMWAESLEGAFEYVPLSENALMSAVMKLETAMLMAGVES